MRHLLPVIALILLAIMDEFKFKSSVSARRERPSSFHPRRIRVSFRDRTTSRKYFRATRGFPGVKDVVPVGSALHSSKKSAYEKEYSDPLWTKQWYAQDYRKAGAAGGPVMDLNLVPVYRQGVTGRGVTVAVVDNGVDGDHPDLSRNYWKEGSYDFRKKKQEVVLDADNALVEKLLWLSSHGTLCAGVIGMEANNRHCGVGVAYEARIVGLKAIGSGATNAQLHEALSHKLDEIDIFVNSYGPADDGVTMLKLDEDIKAGIQKGVAQGRGGKGAIYVFSSGNGGYWDDNCAADGNVNSNLTMGIAGASFRGRPLLYGEPCAAIFATTYAKSVPLLNEGAVTTVPGTGCSTSFMGTSAACPIAAGMIALMLQANKDLTHRDVMHVVAMSSEVAPLAGSKGWYKNGAGFWVNNFFGFGMLNAGNMVKAARGWPTVPEMHTCVERHFVKMPAALTPMSPAVVSFSTSGCSGTPDEVRYLEQIELEMNVAHSYRGAIEVFITSPHGTVTQLMKARKHDKYVKGLKGWSVKSVHNWGENPQGRWKIEVSIKLKQKHTKEVREFVEKMKRQCGGVESSCVDSLALTMHGTGDRPAYHDGRPGVSGVPRAYEPFVPRDDVKGRAAESDTERSDTESGSE